MSNEKNNLTLIKYIKYSLAGLIVMHFTGMLYLTFQFLIFNKTSLIFYNIGLFTLNKLPFQIISLFPVYFGIKIIKNLKD